MDERVTKRQQEIACLVARDREQILAMVGDELADKPAGFSVAVRLLADFLGPYVTLKVTKEQDGLSWVAYDPLLYYRKGWTMPKPRRL